MTRLALVSLAHSLPAVLLFPLAGVVVARIDRRLAMLEADILAGASWLRRGLGVPASPCSPSLPSWP